MSDMLTVSLSLNKKVESVQMPSGSKVEDMLRAKGLFPDAYIVLRGKTPVPITELLADGDELRVIKVASGG